MRRRLAVMRLWGHRLLTWGAPGRQRVSALLLPRAGSPRVGSLRAGSPRGVRRQGLALSVPLLGALAVVLCFGAGCQRKTKTPLERGQGIFLRTCSGCHGGDGRGATYRTGFTTPPRDLTDPALHERLGAEGIEQVVRVGKGQMTGFGGVMTDEDIRAVTAYVATLKRP